MDFVYALLFALGIVWCMKIIQRARADWREFRGPGSLGRKIVIVIIWIITLYVAEWILRFAWDIIYRIFSAVRTLLS
jgi:hypothetical protein